MTIEELADLISKAAKVTFAKTRDKYGEDELIGYALISHDTADSCFPAVATKNGAANYKSAPESYFLFSPVEWDGVCDSAIFYKVNEEIGKLYDLGDYEQDPDWHNKFREFVFESHVRGLELLIGEGFFGTEVDRNKTFIVFCLSDSETSETHLPHWVKRLNTESVNETYLSKILNSIAS